MITPPEVFTGAKWGLTLTEADVNELELASFLSNLEARDMSQAQGMHAVGALSDCDMNAAHTITAQKSVMEQIRDSLSAAVAVDDKSICHDMVLTGLDCHIRTRLANRTIYQGFRPAKDLQRETILAVPYEKLDTWDSFFSAVELLVGAGTVKLFEQAASRIGIDVTDVERQLIFMKESTRSSWW